MLKIKQLEKLEKLENDYLDLQIKELNEEEKRENEKIKEDLKVKNFVLNNLDNKEYSFSFDFYCDEDLKNYYGLFINITYNKKDIKDFYKTTLTQYYTYSDYYQITIITDKEINKFIDYQNQKNKENIEEDLEFEI